MPTVLVSILACASGIAPGSSDRLAPAGPISAHTTDPWAATAAPAGERHLLDLTLPLLDQVVTVDLEDGGVVTHDVPGSRPRWPVWTAGPSSRPGPTTAWS